MDKVILSKEITIEANTDNLYQVLHHINEMLQTSSCSKRDKLMIDMAVEELFVNIASYAYAPGTGSADIRIELLEQPSRVRITFSDSGTPYDPLKKADPDLTLPAEERPIGGLGIYMVKEKMDAVYYEYREGHNVLTIVKNLE